MIGSPKRARRNSRTIDDGMVEVPRFLPPARVRPERLYRIDWRAFGGLAGAENEAYFDRVVGGILPGARGGHARPGLHRPRRRLRLAVVLLRRLHDHRAGHSLAPDLAVPDSLAQAPPRADGEAPDPKADRGRLRWTGSAVDRALHGRGQAPEPRPPRSSRLLQTVAHDVPVHLPVRLVILRHRLPPGQASDL